MEKDVKKTEFHNQQTRRFLIKRKLGGSKVGPRGGMISVSAYLADKSTTISTTTYQQQQLLFASNHGKRPFEHHA